MTFQEVGRSVSTPWGPKSVLVRPPQLPYIAEAHAERRLLDLDIYRRWDTYGVDLIGVSQEAPANEWPYSHNDWEPMEGQQQVEQQGEQEPFWSHGNTNLWEPPDFPEFDGRPLLPMATTGHSTYCHDTKTDDEMAAALIAIGQERAVTMMTMTTMNIGGRDG